MAMKTLLKRCGCSSSAFAPACCWVGRLPTSLRPPKHTSLRFEVTVAPGLLKDPTDGRMLVVLSRNQKAPKQPRRASATPGLASRLFWARTPRRFVRAP